MKKIYNGVLFYTPISPSMCLYHLKRNIISMVNKLWTGVIFVLSFKPIVNYFTFVFSQMSDTETAIFENLNLAISKKRPQIICQLK